MFNLLIRNGENGWKSSPVEFEESRVAIEYTADEISERYKLLDKDVINELKSFPSLFVTEVEMSTSRIGYITDIKRRSSNVVVHFEFDPVFPELPIGTIEALRVDIYLGSWELSRTHWAIKDVDLYGALINKGYITEQQVLSSQQSRGLSQQINNQIPAADSTFNNSQIFIVHGHDELAKLDIAKFITSLGFEPVILHMQASGGKTIIEKIEEYTNVGFGIVLYTPCDIGAKRDSLTFARRARQNVVFEHGFLIAKLGRDRVTAMVKGEVETPNDISGIIYITFDDQELWKKQLTSELINAGYNVNLK